MLEPIGNCLVNGSIANSLSQAKDQRFLENAESPAHVETLMMLEKIWTLYTASTPKLANESISWQQVEVLKRYLSHMETMPIKADNHSM